MARPGLTQHRKFLRLARLLGSAPLALGCLELMWEKCYQNGEPYLGDAIDVEAASQWSGENGALCRALLAAGGDGGHGFIDELLDKPGHFECHDLFDHAPTYVGKRMARELKRIEAGITLTQIRAEAGSRGGKQTGSKRAANGQQTDSKAQAGEQQIASTPAPAPAPAPAPLKICGEPGDPGTPPAVVTLACVGAGPKAWPVTEAVLQKWREAFPTLDVLQEARRMRLWLDENPTRRKTYAGMGKFTLGWLGRAQNDSRASPRASTGQTAMASDTQARSQVQKLIVPKLAAIGGAP